MSIALVVFFKITICAQTVSDMVCNCELQKFFSLNYKYSYNLRAILKLIIINIIFYFQPTDINNALYSVSWYVESIEFRKLMTQFQVQLQTPLAIKSFEMYPINVMLFASTVRISYGIMNLMLAQFNRK